MISMDGSVVPQFGRGGAGGALDRGLGCKCPSRAPPGGRLRGRANPDSGRITHVVRLVFANQEVSLAEALLARHLESNVLGEAFTENSFVIEPVHYLQLLDPRLIDRHVHAVLALIGDHI